MSIALLLAGCGRSEAVISTSEAQAAFRTAGFTDLTVETPHYWVGGKPGGRIEQQPDAEIHYIYAPPGPTPARPFVALAAVRFPSTGQAERVYDLGYSPKSLTQQIAELRRYQSLPRGFALERLTTARVCNVIVASYNANGDPALYARVERALDLLRGQC